MAQSRLTEEERYQIATLLATGDYSLRGIAEKLKRAPSTISREVKNHSVNGVYNPRRAHEEAIQKRVTKGQNGYVIVGDLRNTIDRLLNQKLSPEKISEVLRLEHSIMIHYSTIYRYVYQDKQEGGTLYKNLRIAKKKRRTRRKRAVSDVKEERSAQIPDRVSIDERPARMGDCEANTIVGKGHKSVFFTLVDRCSLYLRIIRLSSKNPSKLAECVSSSLEDISHLLHSITFDNSPKFSAHSIISERLGVDIYFAAPHSPWRLNSIENTNVVIRRYFPKDTDFNELSDAEIIAVQDYFNRRPRKSLGYFTPNEVFLGIEIDLLD